MTTNDSDRLNVSLCNGIRTRNNEIPALIIPHTNSTPKNAVKILHTTENPSEVSSNSHWTHSQKICFPPARCARGKSEKMCTRTDNLSLVPFALKISCHGMYPLLILLCWATPPRSHRKYYANRDTQIPALDEPNEKWKSYNFHSTSSTRRGSNPLLALLCVHNFLFHSFFNFCQRCTPTRPKNYTIVRVFVSQPNLFAFCRRRLSLSRV